MGTEESKEDEIKYKMNTDNCLFFDHCLVEVTVYLVSY